jgi:regulator of protease activity HflC (stomatin/prohibitin superfamily)
MREVVSVIVGELKNNDLSQDMRRVIAVRAGTERERRAKVIAAEGEYQAAQRLAEALEQVARWWATRYITIKGGGRRPKRT